MNVAGPTIFKSLPRGDIVQGILGCAFPPPKEQPMEMVALIGRLGLSPKSSKTCQSSSCEGAFSFFSNS